ncbi:MAG: ABC transporter substrate-binding protein [Paludibaculum sp.]
MPRQRDTWSRRAFLALTGSACLSGQEPYLDKRSTPLEYAGPGRELGRKRGVDVVRIGFFGPCDAAHVRAGSIWMGAMLALEDANRAGGYLGKPFELVERWSDDVWRSGASAVVRLAYTDEVWAILGGIDGATTHLAEQVVAKALLPLVDPVSTDQTVNHANVPWMFSCAPGDPAIAAYLTAQLPEGEFTVVAGTDHDSRNLAKEFLKAAAFKRRLPAQRHDIGSGPLQLPALQGAACVILASPAETEAVMAAAPEGMRLLAGPAARSRGFSSRRHVVTPRLHSADDARIQRLVSRFGRPADDFSLLAYDAAQFVVEAIREAGLNRALIRDRLAPHFGPRGRRIQEVSS